MIGNILHGLTIVRHAVAITIVMAAAGATVAGSVDTSAGHAAAAAPTRTATMTTSASNETTTSADLEALVKECLATKDAQSLTCANAVDASGLSLEDFWAKVAMSLSAQLAAPEKNEPKSTEPVESAKPSTSTHELFGLITACVATHERTSEPCQKALALSGLTPDEFWTKVSALFPTTNTEPKPQTQSSPSTDTAGLEVLIKDCLARYAVAKNGAGDASLASEACRTAIAASGLSSTDFWSRFGPKVEMRTPAPTRKPEETKKPTTTSTAPTVTTAQVEVMAKDCFTKYLIAKNTKEGGTAAAEACSRAIAASGLSAIAFWAKFGTPGSN